MSKNATDKIVEQYKLLRHRVSANSAARLLASLLLVVGLFAGAYLVEQGYRYFTSADVDPVELYFAPENQNLPPNSNFSLMLDAQTNEIGFVDVQFTFDPSKVRLASEISTGVFDPVSQSIISYSGFATVVDRTTRDNANTCPADETTGATCGVANLVLALAPGDPAPSGIVEIARFDLSAFSSTTNETTTLDYVDENSQIVARILDADGNPTGQEAAVISSNPANLTLNASSAGARFYFSNPTPVNPQDIGSQFTIDLMMDTDGQDVDGFDALVQYDSTVLTALSAEAGTVNEFTSYPATDVGTPGLVVISGNVGTSQNATPVNGTDLHVGTITFRPDAASTGTDLTYDFTAGSRNDSNIVLSGTSQGGDPQDILASVTNTTISVASGPTATATPTTPPTTPPTPTATPTVGPGTPTPPSTATPVPQTPTATPTPIANVPVSLRMTFQGLTRSGVSKAKAILLQRRSATGTAYPNISTSTDTNGDVTVSLAEGNYVFLASADGYLTRRYGSFANPISVTSLTNTLSYPPLLGGDFNGDGEINEVDYTLHFLTNFRQSNALVDLDRSGEVNNLDYGVMRTNWGLVSDDFQ